LWYASSISSGSEPLLVDALFLIIVSLLIDTVDLYSLSVYTVKSESNEFITFAYILPANPIDKIYLIFNPAPMRLLISCGNCI
jgi:hypothetical protein